MQSKVDGSLIASPDVPGFQIKRLIGKGGMGLVYLAKDLALERCVALKIIPTTSLNNSISSKFNEARALARINHLNVVQIYSVIENPESIILVMEYLEGNSLENYRRQNLLSLERKLTLIEQICDGLQAVNEAGLMHGDIKPSNIFVTKEGNIKLLDFGITYVTQASSGLKSYSSENYATLKYVSPERLKNGVIDQASEVFSLGILSFELLADHLPVATNVSHGCSGGDESTQIVDAASIVPALPLVLSDTINLMLAAKPSNRPTNFSHIGKKIGQIKQSLIRQIDLDNNTEPLLYSRSVTASIKNPFIYKWSAAILVFVIFALSLTHFQSTDLKYVAVVKPQFSSEVLLSDTQQKRVLATLDDAIRQSVFNIKGLKLISYSESSTYIHDLEALVKATSATDVLTTYLDCDLKSCDVELERLSGDTLSVNKRQRWSTQTEQVYAIFSSASNKVSGLFPEFNEQFAQVTEINQEDYARYIDLYTAIKFDNNESYQTLAQLKQLLEEAPYLYSAYTLYRKVALNLYKDSGDPSYVKNLEQLLNEAPIEYRDTHFYQIELFWMNTYTGDFAQAEKHLELAIKRGLDEVTAIELKGALYLALGQLSLASKAYNKALELRPTVGHLYSLALVHWQLGQSQQAITRLRQLLDITPNEYSANQLLGAILLYTGRLDEAIPRLKTVLGNKPQSYDLSNLAIAYVLNGNIIEARTTLIQAHNQSPQNPNIKLNLADVESILGNSVEAQKLYTELIEELTPKTDIDSLLILAQSHAHLGQEFYAVKALDAAYRLSPDNGEVAFVSALVYTSLEEYQSALVKVEGAINSGIGDIWFSLPWFKKLCQFQKFHELVNGPC